MLIETERLVLRPIVPGDLDEFVALHADPEVTRFIRPLDREAARRRLAANEREWAERGHGMLAILGSESGEFLGRCGLKHWPQFDETELGWALRHSAWGHGYATEAGRACAEWGFGGLGLPSLTAMIGPGNQRSFRVAARLGMERLRDDDLLGEPVLVYGLSRSPAEPS